jgi:hypothetical protein
MTPRQRLVMAPYAFTSSQLISASSVTIAASTAYSTFTNNGNWLMPYGVQASTAYFSSNITASSGTFTNSGATAFSIQTSSGIQLNGGTLSVKGSGGIDAQGTGIIASTGTFVVGVTASSGVFNAQGGTVFSVTTSSGVSVGSTLDVAGAVAMGLTYRAFAGNNATVRCACTATGTKIIAGGCNSPNRAVNTSYPSTEGTDSAGTAGTAVADAATQAFSWTCVFSGANAANTCFATCARIAN